MIVNAQYSHEVWTPALSPTLMTLFTLWQTLVDFHILTCRHIKAETHLSFPFSFFKAKHGNILIIHLCHSNFITNFSDVSILLILNKSTESLLVGKIHSMLYLTISFRLYSIIIVENKTADWILRSCKDWERGSSGWGWGLEFNLLKKKFRDCCL
jgi:hypothetical protein